MSNYKEHTAVNLLLFLPLVLAASWFYVSKQTNDLMILSGCFAYGTLFMSPDLDSANKIKLFSLRGVLTLPFRSYACLFSHRGLSHSFLFGTLTRVLWLFGFGLLFAYLFYNEQPKALVFHHYLLLYKRELLFAFVGLSLADIGHLLVDKL